jgi:hypothetical protein
MTDLFIICHPILFFKKKKKKKTLQYKTASSGQKQTGKVDILLISLKTGGPRAKKME